MVEKKIKVRLLVAIAVLLFSGLAFGYQVITPSGTKNFKYKRSVTIEGDNVPGPHNNFPMMFDSTTTSGLPDDLKHKDEIPPGKVQNINGYDIVFATADGQPILSHEIEYYDSSTGEYIAWVKVDLTGNDQTIYLYYGSTDLGADDTQQVTDVWDSNYEMVQHMADATSSTIEGSTSNGITGTKGSSNNPNQVSGNIGYAQYFNSDTDIITFDDNSIWTWSPVSQNRTLSLWWRSSSLPNNQDEYQMFLWGDQPGWRKYTFMLVYNVGEIILMVCIVDTDYATPLGNFWTSWTPSTNRWYHIALVASSNGNCRIYVDGASRSVTYFDWFYSSQINPSTIQTGAALGNLDNNETIDELRFSHTNRSSGWIATSYNNQKEEDWNFYTVGGVQTLIKLSYFRATSLDSAVLLEWATETELKNEGFNIWRSEEKDGGYVRINPYLIPAKGTAGFGADYSYTDYDVENGVTYYYLLEDVDCYGKSTFHGPVSATPNDIILIWPPDWEPLDSGASIFSWTSSGNFSFKVDVSTSASFSASETITFPEEGWTSGLSFWLRPEEWEVILREAQASGGHLFWRIKAKSQDGRVICSDWRKIIFNFNK